MDDGTGKETVTLGVRIANATSQRGHGRDPDLRA
jgi:hypothetical protein